MTQSLIGLIMTCCGIALTVEGILMMMFASR